MACYFYDITIVQSDIDSAVGNLIEPNGTVFITYTDCDGNPVESGFTVAGTYTDYICASDTGVINLFYYQNDTQSAASSFETQGGICGITPTPTPTNTETPTPTPTNTETPTETPTNTPTPTNTETPTNTPTELYDVYLFEECNEGTQFRFENVPGVLSVGSIYNITGPFFNGDATVVEYSNVGPLYSSIGSTFTETESCPPPTPTPTPTQTSTPTPTPTPTPTQTSTQTSTPTPTPTQTITQSPTSTLNPNLCPHNTFCLSTTLPSLLGYNGNYTQAGTYNDKFYYSGDGLSGGIIYYTGDYWCLSDSVESDICLLKGAYPCYSECPDISANDFNSGICPTPTPTPINCSTFDFEAYFDCDWVPLPTPTPSVDCDDVNFLYNASVLAPTPTPSGNFCDNVGILFTMSAYTPSIVPSLTLTPSVTLTKTVDVQGQVTFNMLDETFKCVSVKVLTDCQTGQEIYVNNNLIYNEIPIVIGITMFASINGENVCVTYTRDDSNFSSNATVNEIFEIYSECSYCSIIPTPTPTATSTPTMTQTPTVSPTATSTPTMTQTPTQTSTSGIDITPTPTSTTTPTMTQTPTQTSLPAICKTTSFNLGISATCAPFNSSIAANRTVYLGNNSGTVSMTFNFPTFSPGSQITIYAYYNNTLIGTSDTYNYPSNLNYTFNVNYNPTVIGVYDIKYVFLNCHNFSSGSNFTTINSQVFCPNVTPVDSYVYVYQSCNPISPNSLQTQIVQTIQVGLTNEIGIVFKDNDGNCWEYLGEFLSTYIPPTNVVGVTYSGNYFDGIPSQLYSNCETCEFQTVCEEYFNNTTGNLTVSYTSCSGQNIVNEVVGPNQSVCAQVGTMGGPQGSFLIIIGIC